MEEVKPDHLAYIDDALNAFDCLHLPFVDLPSIINRALNLDILITVLTKVRVLYPIFPGKEASNPCCVVDSFILEYWPGLPRLCSIRASGESPFNVNRDDRGVCNPPRRHAYRTSAPRASPIVWNFASSFSTGTVLVYDEPSWA
jgi:hypothetical protein